MNRYWNSFKNRFFLKSDSGPLGVGVVGIDGWGLVNAISLMKSGRYTIKGIYDLNQTAAQRFAGRYRVPVYESYESMLADTSIDCVVLSVPNPVHEDMVSQAAMADKHVFVEKPLASNPMVCGQLVNICTDRNLTLMVGHQMGREPEFRAMKRIIDAGTLGDPIKARGIRTINKVNTDWRDDPLACPGGSMEQLGVHLIDVMVSFFGKPTSYSGRNKNIPQRNTGHDWGYIEMQFEGGVSGVVESSFSSESRLEFEIVFTEGRLQFDGKQLILHGDNQEQRVKAKGIDGSVDQFVEFADCVERGKTPETDGVRAQLVMEVVQAVHGSQSPHQD